LNNDRCIRVSKLKTMEIKIVDHTLSEQLPLEEAFSERML